MLTPSQQTTFNNIKVLIREAESLNYLYRDGKFSNTNLGEALDELVIKPMSVIVNRLVSGGKYE